MFLGLRSVIYPAPDLPAAKAWWTALLGIDPYFDEPFYVGFDLNGYELGLDPSGDPALGAQSFWGVDDIDRVAATIAERGAAERGPIVEVGESIRMATFTDPTGSLIGIIENPNFAARAITNHAGRGR